MILSYKMVLRMQVYQNPLLQSTASRMGMALFILVGLWLCVFWAL